MTNNIVEVPIAVVTEMGSHVYTTIKLPEDYTMNMVVQEVKRLGYVSFRLTDAMKKYVHV